MKLIAESITLPALYTVPESTIQARDSLLEEMDRAIRGLTQITTAEQLAIVNYQGVQLQGHKKETEADGLAIRREIDRSSAAVIAHQRTYLQPIEEALAKRNALMKDFHQRERLRVEQEEADRKRQLEKLELERRQAEEAAAKVARGKRQIAAQIQAEEQAHQIAQEQEALIRAPLPVAAKPKGSTFGQKLKYRVTDIHALYKARPDLCKIEEKAGAINAVCDPSSPVPGLELWWEDKAGWRRGAA